MLVLGCRSYPDPVDEFRAGEKAVSPTDCGGATQSEISIDGDEVQVNMGRSPYSGSLRISALAAQLIGEPFIDPFVDETIQPKGHFVAIRFEFENELSDSVQPSSVIFDNLQVTDGKQIWSVADYNGFTGAPSWAWSVLQGDEQGATDVAPGFKSASWALFDVPTDVRPTWVAYRSEGRQYCLEIPYRP